MRNVKHESVPPFRGVENQSLLPFLVPRHEEHVFQIHVCAETVTSSLTTEWLPQQ